MRRGVRKAPGGFTIIELLFVILIIFLLMGLLIGGIKYVSSRAKGAADMAAVKTLGQGANLFKQQFGFFPPLVCDGYEPLFPTGPLTTTTPKKPVVYTVTSQLNFLKTTVPWVPRLPPLAALPPAMTTDMRFSIYALPYYLLGVLDDDGKPGAGFRGVKRDGSFESAGRVFDPFFDVSRNAKAVFETVANSGKIELRDSHGVAFRYYRWINGDASGNVTAAADLHIPDMVANPNESDPQAKSGEYAIVAAGPNGVFGDEALLPAGHPQVLTWDQMATKVSISGDTTQQAIKDKILLAAVADNIVEVLK